jgi:adenylate cyclase
MDQASHHATRLRLASGLVLLAFVTTHLLNHSLGILGLDAMEAGRFWFETFWRSPPATLLLVLAFVLHTGLALARLYRRRSLRMPAWELVQILLGLAIPFLLALHVIGTRVVHELHGVTDSYLLLLLAISQGYVLWQIALLLIVWLHGCIGVHFWLRLRPWYRRLAPLTLGLAVALPTLALAGFAAGLREATGLLARAPEVIVTRAQAEGWPDPELIAWIYATESRVRYVVIALILLVLAARLARDLLERRGGRVRITYPDGRVVAVASGTTVLEASRSAGVPHASVCGGRGRCSTCRVRVGAGADGLPPPSPSESRVLARLGAAADVRLACQLRPTGDLAVTPLLPASAGPREALRPLDPAQGIERELSVLFADLRGFTRIAEGRLPYDVVFLLNQYFRAMGEVVEREGGRVDKFIGDGIMALFGIDRPPDVAARQALAAARAMAFAIADLERHLGHDLGRPLRIAIGLHNGPVILGEMGFRGATTLTAVGDTVNVASRLEALAKEEDATLVVSARLADRAGVDLAAMPRREIELRGRSRPLAVHVVHDARELPEIPVEGTAAAPRLAWLRVARAARE